MAKSQFNKTKTIIEKVTVKGYISNGGACITYTDENKEECTISILELTNMFAGKPIDFSLSLKTDEEFIIE